MICKQMYYRDLCNDVSCYLSSCDWLDGSCCIQWSLHIGQTEVMLTECFLLLPAVLRLLHFRVPGVDLVTQERGAKLSLQLHDPLPCARQLCGAVHLCGLPAAILWGLHFLDRLTLHDALGPGFGPGTFHQGRSTSFSLLSTMMCLHVKCKCIASLHSKSAQPPSAVLQLPGPCSVFHTCGGLFVPFALLLFAKC